MHYDRFECKGDKGSPKIYKYKFGGTQLWLIM